MNTLFTPFGKIVIVQSLNVPELDQKQYKFPKSKKRRINKKWSKNTHNFKVFFPMVFKDNTIFVHPNNVLKIFGDFVGFR